MSTSLSCLFFKLPLVLVWGLVFYSLQVCAKENVDISQNLRFGITTLNEPPLVYLDQHSKKAGFVIDLVNALGRELEVEIDFIHLSRKGLEQAVLDGYIDFSWLSPSWTKNIDRLIFSEPFLKHRAFLYSLSEFPNTSSPAEWLNGKSVCLRNDYQYPKLTPFIMNKTAYAVLVSGEAKLFTLLAKGRCDLLHKNEYLAISEQANQIGERQVFRSPEPIAQAPVSFIFDKNRFHNIKLINEALAKIKKSGELNRILERSLAESIPSK